MTTFRTGASLFAIQWMGHGSTGAVANVVSQVCYAGHLVSPHFEDLLEYTRVPVTPDFEKWVPRFGEQDVPGAPPPAEDDVFPYVGGGYFPT